MSDTQRTCSPPLYIPSPGPSHLSEKSLPPSPPPPSTSHRSTTHSSKTSSSASRTSHREIPTIKELMRLLSVEQDVCAQLRHERAVSSAQLVYEQDRADTAERTSRETILRFKESNAACLVAQEDASRLREELRQYRSTLEEAQRQIFRAQEVLREVEDRRREAEEEAASLRKRLRKMSEEKLVQAAREEGRKQGLREGMEMGRGIGYHRGKSKGYASGRSVADRLMLKYFSPPDQNEIRRSRGELEDEEIGGTGEESDFAQTVTSISFPHTLNHTGAASSSAGHWGRSLSPVPPPSSLPTSYSPARSDSDLPSDVWIQHGNSSHVTRIPPPLDFSRPSSVPEMSSYGLSSSEDSPSPPPPPPISMPVSVPSPMHMHGESIRMVPEPRSPARPPSAMSTERRRPRTRRRSSSGDSVSSSTHTSELDLLHVPEPFSVRGARGRGLSAIAEVPSFHEFQDSPNLREMDGESGRASNEDGEDEAGFVHVSAPMPRAPEGTGSISSSANGWETTRLRSFQTEARSESRASSSTNPSMQITVQPPSRPASQITTSSARPIQYHSSPADAAQGGPTPAVVHTSRSNASLDADMDPSNLSSYFPPGFVPTGPPTGMQTQLASDALDAEARVPLPSTSGSHNSRLPPSSPHLNFSGSTLAAPLPSSGGSAKSVRTSGERGRETPVMVSPRLDKFVLRPGSRSESDGSSSLGSTDTLSTPPRRFRAPSSQNTRSPNVDALYVRMNSDAGVTPAGLGRVRSISTDRSASVLG